jgi:hypothetical protein
MRTFVGRYVICAQQACLFSEIIRENKKFYKLTAITIGFAVGSRVVHFYVLCLIGIKPFTTSTLLCSYFLTLYGNATCLLEGGKILP